MEHVAASKRTPCTSSTVIPDACSDVFESGVDFPCGGHRSTLKHWGGTKPLFGLKVAFNHPIDSARPLRMGGTEDLVEHVEVDAKAFDVVLDGSETEVDEVNAILLDQNVVAR